MNDHDVLYGGVRDVVIESQANARRWARMVELHKRHADTDGNFAMTAREWTAVETSEVWGISDRHARRELNVALFLVEHRLDDPADWARCAEKVSRYLAKHLTQHDDPGLSVVTCTITQLRNKLDYETRGLRPADDDFERAHADRSVRAQEFDDGMGQLSITASVDEVRLARHRLPGTGCSPTPRATSPPCP